MHAIQIAIIVFSVFALSRLILRRKDRAVPLGELIFWAVIWVGAILIALFPTIFSDAAASTGFGRAIDLIIAVTVVTLFYLQFRLYVKVEKQGQDITRLIRALTIQQERQDEKDGKKRK